MEYTFSDRSTSFKNAFSLSASSLFTYFRIPSIAAPNAALSTLCFTSAIRFTSLLSIYSMNHGISDVISKQYIHAGKQEDQRSTDQYTVSSMTPDPISRIDADDDRQRSHNCQLNDLRRYSGV